MAKDKQVSKKEENEDRRKIVKVLKEVKEVLKPKTDTDKTN